MPGNTARDQLTGAGLRVSDAERDAVAEELARHLQDGRLDAAEFDERVSQAMTARTQGDLDRLLADLPQPAPEQPPGPRQAGWPRAGWPFPLVPIALVALFAAAAATGGRAGDHEHAAWGLWWLLWLIPVAFFAARRRLRGRWSQTGR
jgi:Domain of unknown function (DUF1707)